MADPTDLHTLAQEVLDACADALDTIPFADPTLEGAPTRQYVSPGQPADDCEQLTVFTQIIAEAGTNPTGLAAGKRSHSAWLNHVTFIGRITRCCFPIGTDKRPPTEAELEATSAQTDADAWALWNHLHNLIRAGQLIPECEEVFFDGIRSIAPSGGCGGWTVAIRAQLNGYGEVIGT